MKILYVWEVAGVASILAKYMRKAGHEAQVIGLKSHDKFGFMEFYNELALDGDGLEFDGKVLKYLQGKDIDVVHVNSAPRLAYKIKKDYPRMKVILEYHGSDARLTPYKEREPYEQILDKVIVSTPDLLQCGTGYEWLPIIVDTEHFKQSSHKEGSLFIKPHDQLFPHDLPYDPTIIYREETPYKYSLMPELFKNFSTYIDVRIDKDAGLIRPPSKTALEALSTGMEIYTSDRNTKLGLPYCFTPENVISEAELIYS